MKRSNESLSPWRKLIKITNSDADCRSPVRNVPALCYLNLFVDNKFKWSSSTHMRVQILVKLAKLVWWPLNRWDSMIHSTITDIGRMLATLLSFEPWFRLVRKLTQSCMDNWTWRVNKSMRWLVIQLFWKHPSYEFCKQNRQQVNVSSR